MKPLLVIAGVALLIAGAVFIYGVIDSEPRYFMYSAIIAGLGMAPAIVNGLINGFSTAGATTKTVMNSVIERQKVRSIEKRELAKTRAEELALKKSQAEIVQASAQPIQQPPQHQIQQPVQVIIQQIPPPKKRFFSGCSIALLIFIFLSIGLLIFISSCAQAVDKSIKSNQKDRIERQNHLENELRSAVESRNAPKAYRAYMAVRDEGMRDVMHDFKSKKLDKWLRDEGYSVY